MHRDFQIALLFLVISSAPVTTSAGSREFEQLVQSLETQHHCKRTRVPMWRLLRPMLKSLGKWLENPAELGLFTDCRNTDNPDK